MSSITAFKIAVPDYKIKRLKQKLALTDFPHEVADVEPWSHGPPLSDIKRLSLYWENGFNWRTVEAKLNELDQYIAKIEVDGYDTYDVHFVHQPSTVKNAIPLLFVHGWPGSFIEVTKILPELIKGGKDFPAFHIVAPSMIDFGFSSASNKVSLGYKINVQTLTVIQKAFNVDQHAEAYHRLMLALGYNEYGEYGNVYFEGKWLMVLFSCSRWRLRLYCRSFLGLELGTGARQSAPCQQRRTC
jgi:pimeloyl-ACP methyl ester carboxylesterase